MKKGHAYGCSCSSSSAFIFDQQSVSLAYVEAALPGDKPEVIRKGFAFPHNPALDALGWKRAA